MGIQNMLVGGANLSEVSPSNNDYYPTPRNLVHQLIKLTLPFVPQIYDCDNKATFFDFGAGDGTWGDVTKELVPWTVRHGAEIDIDFPRHSSYDYWNYMDMFKVQGSYDLIFSNPPYSVKSERKTLSHIVPFILERMSANGVCGLLLPASFLETKSRRKNIFHNRLAPSKVFVMSNRISFYSADDRKNGKTSGDYKSYIYCVWSRMNGMYNNQTTVMEWVDNARS